MTLLSILLLVVVLAVVCRVAASAARVGLVLLAGLLVLVLGLGVWRHAAMPSSVRVAYSADAGPSIVQVRVKKTVKAKPAPVLEAEEAADEPDQPGIPLDPKAAKAAKPARPAWVDRDPVQAGDVRQVSVSSGPQERLAECPPALDLQLKKAVAAYIDNYFGPEAGGNRRVSDIIKYDLGYIKKHLMKRGNTFEEKLQMSFGPMYQTHALLEFGPEFRKDLENRRGVLETYAREMATAYRLRGLALGFGAVLCLLSVVFGYFRLDTATRGYYTGRLQFLAAAAILGVIVAGAVLASHAM